MNLRSLREDLSFHTITGTKGDNITGHGREVRTVQKEDGDFPNAGHLHSVNLREPRGSGKRPLFVLSRNLKKMLGKEVAGG